MSIQGIDIASHQGPDFPFAQARQQGFEFAIIKASGGHDYRNEYLAQQVAGARSAGMALGFYHYQFEPTSGGGDAGREAANFIAAIHPHWRSGDSIWLDVEEYPQAVGYTGSLGDWIVRWCDLIEAEFGVVPGIYCATWYLQPTGLANDQRLARYPFWMASWQDALPAKSAMQPWDRVSLWQYNATYTGLTGAHLDCDEFQGTREELIALGTPQAPISQAEVISGSLGKEPLPVATDTPPHDDSVLAPITFTWNDPVLPGKGVVTKVTIEVYNPDERQTYRCAWEAGAYGAWEVVQ